MGREIRRVPPNWEHPRYTPENAVRRIHGDSTGEHIPLYDRSFREAMSEWWQGYQAWERGKRPEYFDPAEYPNGIEFWEWEGSPPNPTYYRPDWPEGSATWWQVYETVSEGTPTTPPFETADELVDWLATNKDFWGYGPQPRERAESFVKVGWVPSMIIGPGGVKSNLETLDL